MTPTPSTTGDGAVRAGIALAALALLLACADAFAAAVPEAGTVAEGFPAPLRVLAGDTFEETLPGQLPAGWSLSGGARDAVAPLSRYVTNARGCAGRASLAYDFPELSPNVRAGAESHGYLCRRLPPVQEGWCVLSFCFRCDEGKLAVEIRGPHTGGTHYQVFGLEIGDRGLGAALMWRSAAGPRARAGQFRAGAWARAVLCFPSQGAQKAHAGDESLCSFARLDALRGDGTWEIGEWRSTPVGNVSIDGAPTHFDFLGYGRCRMTFDDILWARTEAPPMLRNP